LGYHNFLQVDTSIYWIVESILQVNLNLPRAITDVYVADITRCYESIPLDGCDNLLDALCSVIRIGYQEQATSSPKNKTSLWIKLAPDGTPTLARWATSMPKLGYWIDMPEHRLGALQDWLMHNCFLVLGDRVWRQIRGIPMGFSCSPLWCNIYLLFYEITFIQRLVTLQRHDLLSKFQYVYRYIDDLCWINVGNPQEFLNPTQPRTPQNPF
jgi:hypothetical protein